MKVFFKAILVTLWIVLGDYLNITIVDWDGDVIPLQLMSLVGFWVVFWGLIAYHGAS